MTGREKIEELKKTRPDVVVSVVWELDPWYTWDGDGPEPEYESPHVVTVTASTIRYGTMIKGNAYLCGCYSLIGGPHCREVHGYLPQMIDEALAELETLLKIVEPITYPGKHA